MNELNVKEIACETAYEFVDYLRLSKDHWGDLRSSTPSWLFRGQRNSDLRILPSLFRPFNPSDLLFNLKEDVIRKLKERISNSRRFHNTKIDYIINQKSGYRPPHLFDCVIYYFLEKKLLHDFISSAESNAFEIPDLDELFFNDPIFCDEDHFNKLLEGSIPKAIDNMEIPEKIEYLKKSGHRVNAYIGLAQHHGISTRLVDMTYNSLTAAFFATYNFQPDLVNENGKIVVWAINKHIFSPLVRADLDRIPPFQNNNTRLASYQLYQLPRNKNVYLHRQEGLFIYPEYPYDYYFEKGDFPSFENYLNVLNRDSTYMEYCVKKITLPYNQVFTLLQILEKEGVTKVKMMPTLDNVVETLKNKWRWEAWSNKEK